MAWLTDYTYRKGITLSRPSGQVTNYQLKILVGESSGSVGASVHCEGHCLSSFNDIRFTPSDGETLLDYWIESISGTTPNQTATIWVEFDTINTTDTNFYMYYGNAGASLYSNGYNTFIAFDDFERGNDGDAIGGEWVLTSGVVEISTTQKFNGTRSGEWIGDAASPVAYIPVSVNDNIAINIRLFKETSAAVNAIVFGNGTKYVHVYQDASAWIGYYDGAWNGVLGSTSNVFNKLEVQNVNFTAGTFDIYQNDILIKTSATMETRAGNLDKCSTSGPYVVGQEVWIDNFIARNYNSTEPSFGTWSTGESHVE